MEQHPVPQNISSYQFHLVGDMTLKQFLELATGVVIGVIIYATGLPSLIKWPLIFFSAISGAALAFVPFQERPLEQWIFAFFRSVYSPTLFHWEKQQNVKYFQDDQPTPEPSNGNNASAGTAKSATTSAFARIPFLSKLEDTENTYLNKIGQLFAPTATVTPIQPEIAASDVSTTHPLTRALSMTNEKQAIQIPQTTFISVDKNGNAGTANRPHIFVEESGAPVNLDSAKVAQTLTASTPAGQTTPLVQAQFSTQAAPPSLPTIPNTVSGQVMDASGNIIEGAIMEIRDETGRPVRALKTNKAGHFLTVTALTDGKYQLHIEKEGFTFDPLTFETSGGIIMPIAIRAK